MDPPVARYSINNITTTTSKAQHDTSYTLGFPMSAWIIHTIPIDHTRVERNFLKLICVYVQTSGKHRLYYVIISLFSCYTTNRNLGQRVEGEKTKNNPFNVTLRFTFDFSGEF